MKVKTKRKEVEWRNIMNDKVEITDKKNALEPHTIIVSSLVIEDNTIYEIDGECMNCLNKEKNIK